MARVTVEDCLENMDNRFQLVMVASKRARQLANGSDAQLEWEMISPPLWRYVKLLTASLAKISLPSLTCHHVLKRANPTLRILKRRHKPLYRSVSIQYTERALSFRAIPLSYNYSLQSLQKIAIFA